jgi:lysozyme
LSQAAAIVVAAALSVLGKPYAWGGAGPDTFDCSGLVQWSYAQAGITVPRTSEEQALGGQPVSRDQLQPGDIIIYYPDASHVALYSGGGNIIQASTPGVPVEQVPIDDGGPYQQARRYLTTEGTTVTLFGPDVSNNNFGGYEAPDLDAATAFVDALPGEGFSWIEAKCSQGSDFIDPTWSTIYAAAQANNLPVVAYHYMDTSDAAGQAQTCLQALGGAQVPIMFDFEDDSGSYENYQAVLAAFQAVGINVALSYIPEWYWEDDGDPSLSSVVGLVSSAYPSTEQGYASTLYEHGGGDDGEGWNSYGGATPVIWQFTDAALIAGITVDANAFQGTLADLQTLLGVTPVTQPSEPTVADVLAVVQDNQTQLRGPGLNGWPQLNGHTLVDALAAIGQALKIDGFAPPSQ